MVHEPFQEARPMLEHRPPAGKLASLPLLIHLLPFLLAPARAAAHEHAPRVLSPHNADAYSLKTFALFGRWRDLEGDAKVFEVYRYLAGPRTGLYPLGVPAWEGADDLPELGALRDPVKMLNVYPIGHCGTLGPAAAGIFEGMGMGPARTLIIPGWGHVAAEVFHGGKWRYVDLDVRAVFRREDGSLASMEEARTDPGLWRGPNGPLFFPLDRLDEVREAYARTAVGHRHGVHTGGHTMDFVLRRGESLRRWWKPQGGRWNHHASYGARPFPRSIIEREPRGPKSKHASFSVHTHGNGLFTYRPDLTSRSADFEDGVHESRNVRPGPEGLTLIEPGKGHAVFEVRAPYVIVPLVGDLDTEEDDREASVAAVEGSGAALAVSLDNGLTWRSLGAAGGALDLTPLVSGRYGYLLRIDLEGEPGAAVVRSLELRTWVQVHPASLPSLRRGENRLEYRNGDHHGLPTHVMELRLDGRDREELLRHLHGPAPDHDPARRTRRITGAFVLKVPAPPGSRIAWFSAGGSFVAHQGAEAPATRNAMAYAVDEPVAFTSFHEAAIPAGNDHWHYNADVEVRLAAPARMLYVRYTADPGMNGVRLYAHCLRDEPCRPSPVVITHAWREGGKERVKSVRLEGPGHYTIEAGEDPEDEYVEIAVPGGGETAAAPRGWVEPMRRVHARFAGRKGTFAHFGDSITVSMAFWASLRGGGRNMDAETAAAFRRVSGYMLPECWSRWKGPAHGNEGRMTIRWADENVESWLEKLEPEVALILFGTNDLTSVPLEEYEAKTRRVVERCLARGTVVILSTLPPRSGMLDRARSFAEAARRVARETGVPLCDYFAECLARRPHDWDGAAAEFAGHEGYEVPTLISRDGVHPSNPRRWSADYSPEGLRSNGFVLRNHVTLMAYAEVIREVLER
jgi:hypothetical protein